MELENLDLIKFDPQPDLLQEVVNQLIKDFGIFGMEIHFSGNPALAYSELFGQVNKHLEVLARYSQQKYISLLYRIDLNEQQIGKALSLHPEEPFSATVTDLILIRELQKVVLRNWYRGSHKGPLDPDRNLP
jgi:hypothetical protein